MLCDYGSSRTSSLLFDLGRLGYKRFTPSGCCSCCTLRVLTWQTIADTGANSVDLDETACNICHSILNFRLKPLFATMNVSKFKDTLCTGAFAETRNWCVLDVGNLLLAATYVHHFCFQTAFFVGLWHGYWVSWFVCLFSWCHYIRLPLQTHTCLANCMWRGGYCFHVVRPFRVWFLRAGYLISTAYWHLLGITLCSVFVAFPGHCQHFLSAADDVYNRKRIYPAHYIWYDHILICCLCAFAVIFNLPCLHVISSWNPW